MTSVVLHLLVAALLLFQLPKWKPTPPEQESVKVEIVPPPKPEPQPKPEPEKKEEKVEAPKPQPAPAPAPAPAASSQSTFPILPRSEKESTEKKPASGEGTTQDDASTPQDSPTEQAETEAGPSATPDTAKPTTPNGAELQSTPEPSESAGQSKGQTVDPTTLRENAPTPKQTAQPVPKKKEQVSKPDGSKAIKSADPFANLSQKFSPNAMLDARLGRIVAHLSPRERLLSLCKAEIIVRLGLQLEDAYVLTGPTGGVVSNTLYNGVDGSFRRNGNWYSWSFQCSTDADVTRISSFRFKVGSAIPRNEWSKRRLPAD